MEKPKIKFLNDCLLINNKILVIGDIHIGYEEYISEKNALPMVQYKEIIEKLDDIFNFLKKEEIKIKKIILLGDLKHEFGEISASEWRETLKLLDYFEGKISKKRGKKNSVVLIKGNHDNILGPIAKKRNVELKKYYKTLGICFLHGNKEYNGYDKNVNILIIGHLHPSITLFDNYKKEKYKCFLKGIWKRKLVYILPSFSPISLGYELEDLNNKRNRNGFLIINEKKLKDFEVIIYNNKEKKEYNFGKLNKLI